MTRYLVVANQTAASSELIDQLKEIVQENDSMVLLVPATPAQHLLTWQDGGSEQAQQVAVRALPLMRSAGLNPEDAIVGDADPLRAIKAELESSDKQYDRVIISTFPLGISRWLKQGLPRQVERQLGVPVTHIVQKQATSGAEPTEGSAQDEREGEALAEGGDWELRGLGEWRGRPVMTSDGYLLSHVSEIIYDPLTTRPVWIGAITGQVGLTPTLIPATASVAEGDHLRVGYTWHFLSQEPHPIVGEGFSSFTEEVALYDYFGIPFDRSGDLRVLREGQEYPDSLAYPDAAA